jgi:hypothetical protein
MYENKFWVNDYQNITWTLLITLLDSINMNMTDQSILPWTDAHINAIISSSVILTSLWFYLNNSHEILTRNMYNNSE